MGAKVKGMRTSILTRSAAALVAVALLCTVASPALAQEEEFYYKRQMAEQYTNEKAWLASASHTPEGSDWVIFGINTVGDDDKGLGIGVIYGHGTVPNEANWAAATFLAPFGIVEFKDDGDGKFVLGSDTVVSVLPLHRDLSDNDDFYEQIAAPNGSVKWYDRPGYKPLEHSTQSVLKVERITLEAETTDGVFTIRMHVSNSIFINETVVLSPYEMKIDFIIDEYPYVEDDTQVALLSIVAVGNAKWYDDLPPDYKEEWQSFVEEDGMNFPIEGGAGYFSWAKQADVDGVNRSVSVNTLAQFAEFKWTPEKSTSVGLKYIAMTYARGERITHDPKLGYVFKDGIPPVLERLVKGSPGLFFGSILLFVAVVATARWTRTRASGPKRARPPTGGAPAMAYPQPVEQQYQPPPPQPSQPPTQPYHPHQQYPPQGPNASRPGAPPPGTGGAWPQQHYPQPYPQQPYPQQPQGDPRQNYRPRQP